MARGRRVRRVVRRIDPWSVLKVSVFFYISLVIVLLIGAAILWSLAQGSGSIGKIERFMEDLGFTGFKFRGGELFKVALVGGIVFIGAATVFTTVLAILYNLISDLVGGIEVQVIEEEAVYAAGGAPPGRRGRAGQPPRRGRPPRPEPTPTGPPTRMPEEGEPPAVPRRTVV